MGDPLPVRTPLLDSELVQSGERQKLQAVQREQLVGAHDAVDLVDDADGAAVSIRHRIGQQIAVGVEQAVVDPPGVDSDRLNLGIPCGKQTDAVLHLRPKHLDVPAQMAAALDHAVGEPVDQFEPDGLPFDKASHHPPARRAEVDRGDDPSRHRPYRRKAAATPESTGTIRPVVWENSEEASTATALATCSGSTSRWSSVRLA